MPAVRNGMARSVPYLRNTDDIGLRDRSAKIARPREARISRFPFHPSDHSRTPETRDQNTRDQKIKIKRAEEQPPHETRHRRHDNGDRP
jgi:hypothetical protein